MPKFSEITVTDAGKPGRPSLFRMFHEEKKETVLPEPIFVSSKKKHDCIIHTVRDERTKSFWRAVENMPQSLADQMPRAFAPLTTRTSSAFGKVEEPGWGGRWPVGMLGVTHEEAKDVTEYSKNFEGFDDAYPPIIIRVLP